MGSASASTDNASIEEDEYAKRVRLNQQLKVMEQQVYQRSVNLARRREEIQMLRAEITNALHGEDRARNEADILRARASDQEEAMQHGRSELEQRLEACAKRVAAQHVQEKEWH